MPELSKDDFLAEKPFTYRGHFEQLQGKSLRFDREPCLLIVNSIDDTLSVHSVREDRFIVYRMKYGRIAILFKECKLEEVAAHE